MTKERAIDLCHAINQYLCAGNPIWDTAEIHDAMSMAIEALEENESLAKSVNDAAELIHKLQKKNEWIPCSERLPKPDTKVLVQTNHGLITDGRWSGDTWFTTDDYTCCKVVAWMPLPSPYVARIKRGEEE